MKRLRTYLFLLIPFILTLTACGNRGKLNEGDCPGVVVFSNVPKEFHLLDENLQREFYVAVDLTNLTTEKEYQIILNQENGFKQTVSMHPGTYKVSTYSSLTYLINLPVKASSEIITFERGRETALTVTAEDAEAFAQYWMETHPEAEILSADKYSGLIQVNRKVIPIKDVVTELDLSDMDKTLQAYQKTTLTDNERGISVILQNQTSSEQPLSNCKVLSLTVSKNTVVFPDGVTLGVSPAKVCHRETGLYGEPTRFEGFFLYGWDLDDTQAVYQDPISGNRITLSLDADGKLIRRITYELEAFE